MPGELEMMWLCGIPPEGPAQLSAIAVVTILALLLVFFFAWVVDAWKK